MYRIFKGVFGFCGFNIGIGGWGFVLGFVRVRFFALSLYQVGRAGRESSEMNRNPSRLHFVNVAQYTFYDPT